MKLFKKSIRFPETSHQPITSTNVHYQSNPTDNIASILSIKIDFDDECTIENKAAKLVSIPLPAVPSFDYGIEFPNSLDTSNSLDVDTKQYIIFSFKPYLLIEDVLKTNDTAIKYEIADLKVKVHPISLNSTDNTTEYHSFEEIKDYISSQWKNAFDEIIDAYNNKNISNDRHISLMDTTNYKSAKPRTLSLMGYNLSPVQLILSLIIFAVLLYICISLYGKYISGKNDYANSNQNPYSNASIDKQVEIAEDVVAKVQGKMGVPQLGENDLGCLQEVN